MSFEYKNVKPEQVRAARSLLSWNQDDLVKSSKVAKKTIADFERGKREPYERTLRDMCLALEAAGIEFLNSSAPGVRIHKKKR